MSDRPNITSTDLQKMSFVKNGKVEFRVSHNEKIIGDFIKDYGFYILVRLRHYDVALNKIDLYLDNIIPCVTCKYDE